MLIGEEVGDRRNEPSRRSEGARLRVTRRTRRLARPAMVVAGGERPSDPRRQRRRALPQPQRSQHIALQECLERPAGDGFECLAEEHVCDVRVAEGRRRLRECELPAHLRMHRVAIRKVIIAPAIRAVPNDTAGVNQQVPDADVSRVRQPARPAQVRCDRLVETHPAGFDLLHHQGRGHGLGDRGAAVARRSRGGETPCGRIRDASGIHQDHAGGMAEPERDPRNVPEHRLIADPATGDLGGVADLARRDFHADKASAFPATLRRRSIGRQVRR